MPTYEYFCPENGRSVEVLHGMNTTLTTWGAVCASQAIDPGTTPASAPVQKRLGTGMVLTHSRAQFNDCTNPTPPSGCCGGSC